MTDQPPAIPSLIPMTPADAGLHLAGLAHAEARKSRRERSWERYAELAAYIIQTAYDAGRADQPAQTLATLPDDAAIERMAAAAWAENRRQSPDTALPEWGAVGEERLWEDWRNMMRAAVATLFPPEVLRQMFMEQRTFRCGCGTEAVVDAADVDAITEMRCMRCGQAMTEVTEG